MSYLLTKNGQLELFNMLITSLNPLIDSKHRVRQFTLPLVHPVAVSLHRRMPVGQLPQLSPLLI